jgi:24-methylenesterol C-methyltransferase
MTLSTDTYRYMRLWLVRKTVWINKAIVDTLNLIGVLPRGMKEVHDMLVFVSKSLVEGGQTGVFTPMHMLVFKKANASKK